MIAAHGAAPLIRHGAVPVLSGVCTVPSTYGGVASSNSDPASLADYIVSSWPASITYSGNGFKVRAVRISGSGETSDGHGITNGAIAIEYGN